jgi:energy-coupling factor transporter ATP-binding protein EcfA2
MYPEHYRAREARAVLAALRAGECAAVLGLSGAGKSNLLRCLAEVHSTPGHPLVLVDANRLPVAEPAALLALAARALGAESDLDDPFAALEALIARRLAAPESSLTLLWDRFDALARGGDRALFGQLRALRDTHKYRLTYVIAARRPVDAQNELAELFFANTFWLGPLSEPDARWTVTRFAARRGVQWEEARVRELIALTGGYPAFLRAACEAAASAGPAALTAEVLARHPAVRARLAEFWADGPSEEELQLSGLSGSPWATAGRPPASIPPSFDTTRLTAKENQLLAYFLAHTGAVCAKDDLIRAVWPEDRVFEQGVRDDSLAQLVRRLREKIEPDPANPRFIHTAPGRGYRLTLD